MFKGIIIASLLLGLFFEETRAQLKVHLPPTASPNTVVHFADGVVADSAQGFPAVYGVPSDMSRYTIGKSIAFQVYDIPSHAWWGYDPSNNTWSKIGSGGMAADSGFIPYANYGYTDMAITNKLRYDTVTTSLYLGIGGGHRLRMGFAGVVASGLYTSTAVGDSALASVGVTANYNTAFGSSALRRTTTGGSNTAVGLALNYNTTGSNNAAVGVSTLRDNVDGTNNTAIGNFAAAQNTSGSYNVAIGFSAGQTNTTGSQNIWIGYNAANGTTPTVGDYNIYMGRSAGRKNTGNWNIMIGDSTGYGMVGGYDNVIIGADANEGPLTATYTVSNNTLIGKKAGLRTVSAGYNTVIGWYAGLNNMGSLASHAIIIGDSVDYYVNKPYQINIGNRIYSDDINRIGIMQKNPTQALEVKGQVRVDTLLTGLGTDSLVVVNQGVLKRILTVTASGTLDFPSTGVNASSDLTVPTTGAVIGDIVSIGIPAGSVVPGAVYMAWVSAADVVTIRLANLTAGAVDPASGVFKVRVNK